MAEGGESSGSGTGGTLPDLVAQCYYRYGLLVATHPKKVILLAICSFLVLCTPLWHLPLPGYLPQEYITSLFNYSVPLPAPEGGIRLDPSPTPTPMWYQGPPRAYIQQIVVKSGVVPWKKGLTISDGYRGPLSSVFHLAQTISNYQLSHNNSVTLGTECLLIEGVVKKIQSAGQVLPHYNCLMLSPADLWARNQYSFLQDPHVLLTVNSLMASYEGQTNVADILFGVPSREIGFRRSRNPQRVITFAVTLALKQYNEEFVSGLEKELTSRFPVHQPVRPGREEITHIYFPSRMSLWEFLLMIFYCVLFVSIYFSILKMDMFKSKFGMAISIQATLIASLCISVGFCAYFGLRPLQSKGKYVYPILAGLIGFENSMALIRSVLSTPSHLDIKIRMAQGLAREGWTITKYFLTTITIVTVSFFLFIPLVQEFCIYGSVVLLCDLYMQLIFLTAVLSIDLRRYEDSEEQKKQSLANSGPFSVNPLFRYQHHSPNPNVRILVSNSERTGTCVPNLHRRNAPSESSIKCSGRDRVAHLQTAPQNSNIMPKRLRVAYFVAKKRMFQRMFMCVFVGWIAFMVYSSGLIEHFSEPTNDQHRPRDLPSVIFSLTNRSSYLYQAEVSIRPPQNIDQTQPPKSSSMVTQPTATGNTTISKEDGLKLLKHRTRSLLRKLPHSHWPTLFSYYNISVTGHYLSILPPILLSLPVKPEDALNVHNPSDPNTGPWIVDNIHMHDSDDSEETDWQEESAFIPSSSGELLLTAVLVIPAVLCLVYAMVALYHCVCSRNYAEWRASWWGKDGAKDETSQIIGDALPLVLTGHPHDVECMCSDGVLLVSSCLAGIIRVWDPSTGECVANINRRSHKKPEFRMGSPDLGDDFHSDYESGSPRSQAGDYSFFRKNASGLWLDEDEKDDSDCEIVDPLDSAKIQQDSSSGNLFHTFPDLSPAIDLHFYSRSADSRNSGCFSRFDKYYEEHKKMLEDDEKYRQRRGRKISDCNEYPSSANITKNMIRSPSYTETLSGYNPKKHYRNLSAGSIPVGALFGHNGGGGKGSIEGEGDSTMDEELSPIWCLECQDALVIVGCGSGRIEVWDLYNNVLKCIYDEGVKAGVTSMRISGNRLMIARLNGAVDMLRIEQASSCLQTSDAYQTFKPGHSRGNSRDYSNTGWTFGYDEPIRLLRYAGVRAHQQPITVMTCDHVRLITGAHDHTLKVFSMTDGRALFTLHGHCGPITSVFVDGSLGALGSEGDVTVDLGVGAIIGSGSQDGMLCVWEVVTGACVYSVQAHDGVITTLTCTTSYILSLGGDDKLCVWERFQGHLLNTLQMTQMYCSSMVMLTNKLLITSRQGSLTVWDITSGVPVRVVRLGDRDDSVFICHMMPVADTIVCDYGNQLRVVKLPVAEKLD
ncbi:sterol regulatory element-binding protein cleavage-activating protein [Procambarus clarkii]|uniref:sterol regulatory element-binding protein cleavage-activating protein n=1 Tax=Procambarus clarkii TaxID=6728 RepID=UPI001E673403|nr:sterol regulatory element-binding protein cleavage-activating protein-like [Procambarus clarkii]XP_045623275.1 sterol regulatory element-binding protein cleavage-activating protein-like [Procambarus clarkii]XP_045623276.1 sterol regulatory element-binding protein cleavage-activating protein-like [Procambarus clarkii]